MSIKEEKQYMKRQLQSLKATTGSYPAGWFVGRCSPHTRALIHEVHQEENVPLLYSSDVFNDDIPYWVDVPAEKSSENPQGMLMMSYSYDCNDLKYQIGPGGWSSHTEFSDYLKASFDTLYAEGVEGRPKMMSIGLHCRISGKPGRSAAVETFLKYILEKEDVWVTTRKDIALHWREKFPYERKASSLNGVKVVNGTQHSNGFH
jgi:peptidoglycan/xylan/chitin deacetylase (PgdA/CDA1 family)